MRSISRSRSRRQEGRCDGEGRAGFGLEGAAERREVLDDEIASQGGSGGGVVKGAAEVATDLFNGEVDGRTGGGDLARCRVDEIDEIAVEGAAAALEDEPADEVVRQGSGVEVGAALEAVGGVGVEEMAA